MQRGEQMKRELEAHRHARHAQPHPALTPTYAAEAAEQRAMAAQTAEAGEAVIEPDVCAVTLHFDVDCFYAQCEELRDPSLATRPLGITQKHIIVTCNRPARARGVTKLMGLAEARRKCPELVLVSGEDLTPFRAASKRIYAVLQRFGTAERLGLDEIFLDVTEEARRRAAEGAVLCWHGHLYSSGLALAAESRHRPMDLRVVRLPSAAEDSGSHGSGHAGGVAAPPPVADLAAPMGLAPGGWQALLMAGSAIAAEARAAVRAETGFRCSAGVAANKLLAKLASGLHKPDDQTILPPPEAAAFVAPLPVRALPGVGHRLEADLRALGVGTAAHLRSLPRMQLLQRFGERVGAFLYLACRGKDPSPVQEKGPPKSVTVEDSFKSCSSWDTVRAVVEVLAPDLLARLQEDAQEHGRRPATLTLKWRLKGQGYSRSSASCPMPAAVAHALRGASSSSGGSGGAWGTAPGADVAAQRQQASALEALSSAAVSLLQRQLTTGAFDLSLINIGATAFSVGTDPGAGQRSIDSLLGPKRPRLLPQQQSRQPVSAATLPTALPTLPPVASAPGAPAPAPASGALAAAQSSQRRRDYEAAIAAQGGGPLLSKRRERQMREAAQAQAVAAHPAPPPACLPPVPAPPPPPQLARPPVQHSQAAGQPSHLDEGFWEFGEEEEEDGSLWIDLRELSATGGNQGGGCVGGAAAGSGPPASASAAVAPARQHPPSSKRPRLGLPLAPRAPSAAAGAGVPPAHGTAAQQVRWPQHPAVVPQAPQALHTVQPPQQEQQQSCCLPPPPRAAASYRNAEAQALLERGAALLAGSSEPAEAGGGTEEEQASLRLALQLQQEELQAAKVQQQQQQRRRTAGRRGGGRGATATRPNGPLDAFLKRAPSR